MFASKSVNIISKLNFISKKKFLLKNPFNKEIIQDGGFNLVLYIK